MGFRCEFDPVNKVLLIRVEGPMTDELAEETGRVARKYSAATGARAGIMDLSSVTEFLVSSRLVGELAVRDLAIETIPRIIVAPTAVGFGLARMFQTVGQSNAPQLGVVRTLDEACAALGVQSLHFEPLE